MTTPLQRRRSAVVLSQTSSVVHPSASTTAAALVSPLVSPVIPILQSTFSEPQHCKASSPGTTTLKSPLVQSSVAPLATATRKRASAPTPATIAQQIADNHTGNGSPNVKLLPSPLIVASVPQVIRSPSLLAQPSPTLAPNVVRNGGTSAPATSLSVPGKRWSFASASSPANSPALMPAAAPSTIIGSQSVSTSVLRNRLVVPSVGASPRVGTREASQPSSVGGSPQIALVIQSPASQKLTPTLPKLIEGQAGAQIAPSAAVATAVPEEDDLFFELPPPVVDLDEDGGAAATSTGGARWDSVQSEDESDDGFDADNGKDFTQDETMVRSPCGTRWVKASKCYSLDHSYSIWFQHAQHAKKKPKSEQQYEEGLQCVGTFNSVQDFWRYWNAIDLAKMPNFCSLSVFKHPIKPMWEDPHNKEGGQWIVRCVDRAQTADFFTKLALSLIGGYFECHEDLCGVVLSMKPKFHSLSLWNCQVEPSLVEPVEYELRELLGLDSGDNSLAIEYKEHGGAIVSNCIKRKEVTDGTEAAPRLLAQSAPEARRLMPTWMQPSTTVTPVAKAATVIRETVSVARTAIASSTSPSGIVSSSGSVLKASAAPFTYNASSAGAYSNGYPVSATSDFQYGQTSACNGTQYDNYYSGGYGTYYASGDYGGYTTAGTYYTTGTGEEQLWTS